MDSTKNNLILIGMPTSGKSTAGVILAKILGMDFVDTDLLIQKRTGQKLSEIIRERSISGFLAVEEEACLSLTDGYGASPSGMARPDAGFVIATGGSVVYSEKAMEFLKSLGTVIYLQIDLQTLNKRLHNARQRGVILREGQSIEDLFFERTPLYEQYADVIVPETGLDMEETVYAIVEALQQM